MSKPITRNRFGLLETTDNIGRNHHFFATRLEAAGFLRRYHRLHIYLKRLYPRKEHVTIKSSVLEERYWGDPSGNIRRMSGEQEVVMIATPACTDKEYRAFAAVEIKGWKDEKL